jgi:O-acetyl-ADP-ribose deacetylase (regulator of RNase III)
MNFNLSEEEQLKLAMQLSMMSSSSSSTSRNFASQGAIGMQSTLVKEHKTSANQTIQVRKGDMTKESVDVIVNAANGHLQHASGLAGAIVKNGGYSIQIESDNIVDSRGRLTEGTVVSTKAGKLPCKFVFHAVGPMWSSRKPDTLTLYQEEEDTELKACVINSLDLADQKQLASISLPAISSGIFGYPKPRCAVVLFDSVIEWLNTHQDSTVKEVRFTNFDDVTVNTFSAEFDKRFSS